MRHHNITATVFGGPNDEQDSAYGGKIDPTVPGVALPHRFVGHRRPKVRVIHGEREVICNVVDIGPWNVDDPYWLTNSRPRTERQHRHRLRDWRGRVPSNDAGIDLTPAAAEALGISGMGKVHWEFV